MTRTFAPSVILPTMLAPLRRLATAIGEGGGILAGLVMALAFTMLDVKPGHQGANAFWLLVMMLVALCIMARGMDGRGHAAVRKLDGKAAAKAAEKAKPSPDAKFLADGFDWLGIPRDSDAAAIKTGVRAMMLKHHSDTGTGALDMDDLVSFRDRMLESLAREGALPRENREEVVPKPSRKKRLKAYEEAAGPLGRAWGRLLPSPLLKELGRL